MAISENVSGILHRELRGRLRVWLGWATAPVFLWALHRAPSLLGVLCVLTGSSLRMWASGCIEKESRLSIGGPFQYMRNPLYMGSLMMTLGFFLTQDFYIAGVLFTAFSLFVYHPLILEEEKVLDQKFPGVFQAYRGTVPRYLPRPTKHLDITQLPEGCRVQGFQYETFVRNKGIEPFLVASSMLIGLWLIYLIKVRFGLF